MEDVNISKYRAQVVRAGSTPASPGFVVSEGQDPVNPSGSSNYVPYSGAISNVDFGEFGLETGFVTLDTTPTNIPTEQGGIYWDDSRSTAALIMNGTLQHIGQDTFFYVKNSTGSSIPKGTAVRFNGTDGASGHLLIAPFLANGTYPSNYFMGVTAEAIANGSFGQVMHFGELSGVNTSGYTAGALLYASTSVAGAFQTTAPVAPNNIVLVAAAINSTNNGTILVRPTYGSNINQDEGVKITSGTTGDLLQLQAGGLWENKTLAQVIGSAYVPSTRTITINGTTQDLSANRTYNVGTVTAVTASSPLFSSGGTTPNITIQQASGSQNGFLSSTDWTTFNNKQNALTNPVTGTGTTNYLPKFTGSTTIGNSNIQDSGTLVTVGVAAAFSSTISGSYGATFVIPSESPASGNVALVAKTSNGANDIFRWFDGATTLGVFKNNGNILIGTTTDAGYKLDVNGTVNFISGTNDITYLRVGNNSARQLLFSNFTNASRLNAGHLINASDSSGTIAFATASVERWRISQTGLFQSNGAQTIQTSTGNLTLATAAGNGNILLTPNGTGFVDVKSFVRIDTYEAGTTVPNTAGVLRILSGSKTGWAPNDELGKIEFFGTDTSGIGPRNLASIRAVNSTGNGTTTGTSNGELAFYTSAANALETEKVRIASTGNVLINTTTDAGYKLDVNGTGRFSSSLIGDYGANFTIPLESPATGNVALIAKTSNGANDIFRWFDGATQLGVFKNSGNVGIGTASPSASSLLDITSTTQGFLPPRMTTTQKTTIASPATGLVVYDTTLNKLAVYTGAAWETVTSL